MEKSPNLSVLNLSRQDIPIITEDIKSRYSWVPVGIMDQDDFFPIIIDAFNTSTTNAACIEGLSDLIYGKGLYSNNPNFDKELMKLLPQEEIKRLTFDLKLFGNGALQVYWNENHTKKIGRAHV